MYSNKLAIAIKSNGKVLREFNDTVLIPFGTEYSVLIKNLNTVKCVVSLSIDGDDIADGRQFIIPAGESMEIERFVKSDNLKRGNRFKFIERTGAVSDHRGGNKIDDGLIRVQFSFEKQFSLNGCLGTNRSVLRGYTPDTWTSGSHSYYNNGYSTSEFSPQGSLSSTVTCSSVSAASGITKGTTANAVNYVNDVGVTSKGSVSNQEFRDVQPVMTDGVEHSMVIMLKGQTEENIVSRPITVQHKAKCTGCGKVNKATAKFCTQCGTSLIII